MDNQIYHLVYLTTNLINGKFYIGVHSTYDLNDGYLGSGTNIQRAIKKYGKENFKRDILYFCLSSEDAYETEKQIVTDYLRINKNCYNLALGGVIGKGNKGIKRTDEFKNNLKEKMSREFSNEHKQNISKSAKKRVKEKGMSCHSNESRNKVSEKAKGKKPNNFGKGRSQKAKDKLAEYRQNNPEKVKESTRKMVETRIKKQSN